MYCILPSHNPPLVLVADIVACLSQNVNAGINELRMYTGKSEPYIKSAISIAKMLDIIDSSHIGSYKVDIDVANSLGKTPNDELKMNVIREYIQQYEPFISFIEFCLNDNSLSDASRKVYSLYGFKGKDHIFLKDLFVSWGAKTGIFKISSDKVKLSDNIDTKFKRYEVSNLSLDEDMAIRLYIGKRLGEDVFKFMMSDEINELTEAFKKYNNDPRGAIECAGRAFEDFLRRIAQKASVDVKSKNGIGQVINSLYNNKDNNGVLNNIIHSKQNSVGTAIGDIRNMAGHSKEAKSMERWDLESQSSLAFIELVVSSIRSIYLYENSGLYSF